MRLRVELEDSLKDRFAEVFNREGRMGFGGDRYMKQLGGI